MNFKVNYSYIGPEGFLYENGTSEGPLQVVKDEKADLTVANWWLKSGHLNFLDITKSYSSEPVIFVVPPAKEFTSFEKLAYPFSSWAWVMIFIVNFFGFLVIFLVKMSSKNIQKFVFGTGVSHPYFNMVTGYIGGVQNVLPGRNFARFLLTMFVIYSLIMRTVYQGLYYQFMQSNMQHKKMETVEEMVKNDFMFPIYKGGEFWFNNSELTRNRFVNL